MCRQWCGCVWCCTSSATHITTHVRCGVPLVLRWQCEHITTQETGAGGGALKERQPATGSRRTRRREHTHGRGISGASNDRRTARRRPRGGVPDGSLHMERRDRDTTRCDGDGGGGRAQRPCAASPPRSTERRSGGRRRLVVARPTRPVRANPVPRRAARPHSRHSLRDVAS